MGNFCVFRWLILPCILSPFYVFSDCSHNSPGRHAMFSMNVCQIDHEFFCLAHGGNFYSFFLNYCFSPYSTPSPAVVPPPTPWLGWLATWQQLSRLCPRLRLLFWPSEWICPLASQRDFELNVPSTELLFRPKPVSSLSCMSQWRPHCPLGCPARNPGDAPDTSSSLTSPMQIRPPDSAHFLHPRHHLDPRLPSIPIIALAQAIIISPVLLSFFFTFGANHMFNVF